MGAELSHNTEPYYVPGVSILKTEMTSEMHQEAVRCTKQALERFTARLDVANYVKREFDRKYRRGTWQCVVGKDFANSITYDDGQYTAFELVDLKLRVVLFRT